MTSDIQYHATWNSDRYQDYIAIQFGHIGINILLTFYFIFNMKYIVPITQQKWKIIKVIYFKLKLFQWCFWTAGGEVLWIHTRPSVRPSVTQYLSNHSKDFSNFWHEVRGPWVEKSDGARFSRKNLVRPKKGEKGPKCPKNGPFWYLIKNCS